VIYPRVGLPCKYSVIRLSLPLQSISRSFKETFLGASNTKLKEAIVVQQEIDSVRNGNLSSLQPQTRVRFVEKILGQKWTWQNVDESTSWFRLNPDGTVSFGDQEEETFTWRIDDDRKSILIQGEGKEARLAWINDFTRLTGSGFTKGRAIAAAPLNSPQGKAR
jgi:hypothetical protein